MPSVMRNILLQKITRKRLRSFLKEHRTDTLTLDVGASYKPYQDLFPNTISGDILRMPSLDLQLDAHHLPFGNNSLSCLLCTEVLEHCVNPYQVISEYYRVLRHGGKLILSTRFIFPLHEAPHDYFRFTEYGLRKLCENFTDVSIEAEALSVETLAILLQRLAYQINWKIPFDKIIKVILLILARLIMRGEWLAREEFGDIRKEIRVGHIMASGYYVVCSK